MRQIRSDQGTNFVGAKNELKKGLMELNKDRIYNVLAEKKTCDFPMNVPEASNMGDVGERQIRTARSVMNSVLTLDVGRLDFTENIPLL